MQIEPTMIIAFLPGEHRTIGKRGEQPGFLWQDRPDGEWEWREIDPITVLSATTKHWYVPVAATEITDTDQLPPLLEEWTEQFRTWLAKNWPDDDDDDYEEDV